MLSRAADLAKTGGEGRQMSLITMGFGLGLALGPLLGAWIVYRYVPETIVRKSKRRVLEVTEH
jgi:MFS family permease